MIFNPVNDLKTSQCLDCFLSLYVCFYAFVSNIVDLV